MLMLRIVVPCPACHAQVDYNRPYHGGDLAARSILCECGTFVGACTVEDGEVTFKVGPAPMKRESMPFLLDPKYNEQLENAPSGFRNFLRGAAERCGEDAAEFYESQAVSAGHAREYIARRRRTGPGFVDAACINLGALAELMRNPVTLADVGMSSTKGPRPKRSRIQ